MLLTVVVKTPLGTSEKWGQIAMKMPHDRPYNMQAICWLVQLFMNTTSSISIYAPILVKLSIWWQVQESSRKASLNLNRNLINQQNLLMTYRINLKCKRWCKYCTDAFSIYGGVICHWSSWKSIHLCIYQDAVVAFHDCQMVLDKVPWLVNYSLDDGQ